jgi:hypothetical protein
MFEDVIASMLLDITDPSSSQMRANALRDQGVQSPGQQPLPEQPMPSPAQDPTQFGATPPPDMGGGFMGMPFQPPAQAAPPMPGPQGASALPQATQAPPAPPGAAAGAPGGSAGASRAPNYGPNDPLMQQYADIQRRQQEAYKGIEEAYQPVDRTAAEEAYKKRAGQGSQNMLLAMAAGQAGDEFKPVGAHFLKQAAEVAAPMKMAGGTMTETGFIEDPGYGQELAVKRATARIDALDKALTGNLTLQERRRLEDERNQRAIEVAQIAAAARASSSSGPGGKGKLLPVSESGKLSEAVGTMRDTERLAQEFDPAYAGVGGALSQKAGQLPGVSTKSAEWWRNYKRDSELIERHGLFGAALSEREAASWRQADINEWMDADEIQRRLDRRTQILREHYNDRVRGLRGYDTEAFPEVPVGTPQAPGGGSGGAAQEVINPQTGQRLKLVNNQWVPA